MFAAGVAEFVEQMGIIVIDQLSPKAAVRAAVLSCGRKSVSLGDRTCLALAEQLDGRAVTADRACSGSGEREGIAERQISDAA